MALTTHTVNADALITLGVTQFRGANGAAVQMKNNSEKLIALSGASVTTSGLIPATATLLGAVVLVTTVITGATTFDVGDGSDVDRYGAAIGLTMSTSTNNTNFTADPQGWSASAQEITLTANGSDFTGGDVLVVAFYRTFDQPGS